MRYCIGRLLQKIVTIFNNPAKTTFSILIALFACVLFLFSIRTTAHIRTEASYPHLLVTVLPTSTRWWIKTASSSPTSYPSTLLTPTSTKQSGIDCLPDVSLEVQPGSYAYISLTPPLPNRVRSGAGTEYSYIGQIDYGAGIKVIDGPVCGEGLSWWLVEANDTSLKGWTTIGNGLEQWIIPCADPNLPCSKVPIILATSTIPAQDKDHNKCKSYMFSIGMRAKVKQSDLLVIRSEPYTGDVIGYAGPGSKVIILEGPICVRNTVWWKVNNASDDLIGWATETNLTP